MLARNSSQFFPNLRLPHNKNNSTKAFFALLCSVPLRARVGNMWGLVSTVPNHSLYLYVNQPIVSSSSFPNESNGQPHRASVRIQIHMDFSTSAVLSNS